MTSDVCLVHLPPADPGPVQTPLHSVCLQIIHACRWPAALQRGWDPVRGMVNPRHNLEERLRAPQSMLQGTILNSKTPKLF